MNDSFSCEAIEGVFKQIEEFARQQMEEKEKTLAEIIKNYDFIVGSKECKCKLMEVLPEGANIICSPYFEDPTIIYAIKKFDVSDLINSQCEEVCEWFEQYVDIATDIVELRFSDGTVKRAKRGLYMRDIEKSIRKMLIDQVANEKKQEPKWIPVSERLPKAYERVLVTSRMFHWANEPVEYAVDLKCFGGNVDFVAWMPLPEPYKAESEE